MAPPVVEQVERRLLARQGAHQAERRVGLQVEHRAVEALARMPRMVRWQRLESRPAEWVERLAREAWVLLAGLRAERQVARLAERRVVRAA